MSEYRVESYTDSAGKWYKIEREGDYPDVLHSQNISIIVDVLSELQALEQRIKKPEKDAYAVGFNDAMRKATVELGELRQKTMEEVEGLVKKWITETESGFTYAEAFQREFNKLKEANFFLDQDTISKK